MRASLPTEQLQLRGAADVDDVDVCGGASPGPPRTVCCAAGRSAKNLLLQSLNQTLHRGLQLSRKAQCSVVIRGTRREKTEGSSMCLLLPLSALLQGLLPKGDRVGAERGSSTDAGTGTFSVQALFGHLVGAKGITRAIAVRGESVAEAVIHFILC